MSIAMPQHFIVMWVDVAQFEPVTLLRDDQLGRILTGLTLSRQAEWILRGKVVLPEQQVHGPW
jgi:hypothetical protein